MTGKIGIYLRISNEERDKVESNSIEGQRELLHTFIAKTHTLAGKEILEFSDDGFSGTNFERPAVQELLKKVQEGAISCILVKDFSRFGRNYLEVGSYIEQIFPSLGVRFIAVNDTYDSRKDQGANAFIGIAFQNLVYDLYSRDLSQKIISGRRVSAEQGKFVTAFAPYGYCKNSQGQLTLDAEAAHVVKCIFHFAVQGTGKTEIAAILNQEGVPSPLSLRKIREDSFFSSSIGEAHLWQAPAINRILQDRRYVGEGVYGKSKRKKIGGTMEEKVPQKDWIVAPNAHEAIVSVDTFERANANRKTYRPARKKKDTYLQKKVYCGGCKRRLVSRMSRTKGGALERVFYGCQMWDSTGCSNYFSGKIEEKNISRAVICSFRQLCLLEQKTDCDKIRANALKTKQMQDTFVKQKRKEKHLKLELLRLYKKYRSQELNKEGFLREKQEIQGRLEEKKRESSEIEKTLKQSRPLDGEDEIEKYDLFVSILKNKEKSFLERVEIEKNGVIKLEFNFLDIFLEMTNGFDPYE